MKKFIDSPNIIKKSGKTPSDHQENLRISMQVQSARLDIKLKGIDSNIELYKTEQYKT